MLSVNSAGSGLWHPDRMILRPASIGGLPRVLLRFPLCSWSAVVIFSIDK